jgi:hypothetical protein
METKADSEVQSKDLAFAAVASTDDCSNCCCIWCLQMIAAIVVVYGVYR